MSIACVIDPYKSASKHLKEEYSLKTEVIQHLTDDVRSIFVHMVHVVKSSMRMVIQEAVQEYIASLTVNL